MVSAASICAKVTRDRLLRDWQFRERGLTPSKRFGSGYPGDANTKKWLRTNIDPIFGFPSVIRFSWKTTTALLDDNAVPAVWPDLLDDHDQNIEFKKKAKRYRERPHFFADSDMAFPEF